MKNIEKKSYAIYTNICNTYRDEDEKVESDKEEFSNDFTEDITAGFLALYSIYVRVTGNKDGDLIGFTHLLNRLAIQFCTED